LRQSRTGGLGFVVVGKKMSKQEEEQQRSTKEDFIAVKSIWARREARDAKAQATPAGKIVVAKEDILPNPLLDLPNELVLFICCMPSIRARDLLALERTCSRFRQGTPSPLTEQAAKVKLTHIRSLADVSTSSGSGAPLLNFKGLLFYFQDEPPIPVFSCPTCTWRIGGFRCQGHRPSHPVREWKAEDPYQHTNNDQQEHKDDDVPPVPVPTGCGCYLMWNASKKVLFCPVGCGTITPPVCACKAYQRGEDKDESYTRFEYMIPAPHIEQDENLRSNLLATYDVQELDSNHPDFFYVPTEPLRKKSPAMTCISCGFTVDGYACLGTANNKNHPSSKPPLPIFQAGFYERVWCCYRWNCPRGCSVFRGGTETPDEDCDRAPDSALLRCVSKKECRGRRIAHPKKKGTEMCHLEWLDTFGPATNYASYTPVRRKEGGI